MQPAVAPQPFRQTSAPPGVMGSLGLVARDIKIAHSVFALPFAVLGAFLARPRGGSWRVFAEQLALIVVCMVLARTWAMLINRLADRRFDAENQRTSRRVFASGALSARRGWVFAGLAAAMFAGAAGLFLVRFANAWPLMLCVPVLGLLAVYSWTKRFTVLCHIVLGVSLAASPLAAAIAVDPESLGRTPALWWLSGMVVAWVAGFDVIYALQDIAFDRGRGLKSIPARLGWRGSVMVSRALHIGAAACLVMAWRSEARFAWMFGAAVVLASLLLITEHVVLHRRGERGLDMAFFTLNGVVSCVIGALGVADVVA